MTTTQMTRENFMRRFADQRSRVLENGGVIYYGSAFGKTEIDIMSSRPPKYEVTWGWCREPYRMVFVDIDGRSTITYCEGDISLTTHETEESFEQEMLSARKCYGKPRYMDRDYEASLPNSHRDPEGEKLGVARES